MKGLLLYPDDLEKGKLCAIHHCTNRTPFLGDSLKITAINLPFVVARSLVNPELPPITLDLRECGLMPVSEDFVAAQRGE